MADTSVQKEVANWITTEFLPVELGEAFLEEKGRLCWGGEYKFDALSASGKSVVAISTSNARTKSACLIIFAESGRKAGSRIVLSCCLLRSLSCIDGHWKKVEPWLQKK